MDGFLILLLVATTLTVLALYAITVLGLTHPPRMSYATALGRGLPTSPEEIGLSYTEHDFSLCDGRTTPGWIVRGKKAGGPTVVLTHGWGEGKYAMLPIAELLGDHVAMMVMYDLRGQGESKSPSSRLGTTEVPDLVGIIEEATRPEDWVVLMGFSMGAGISIAAAAAMRKDGRIKRVIGDGAYRWGMEPIYTYFHLNRHPAWPTLWLVYLHLSLFFSSDKAFDRAAHARRLGCPLLLLHSKLDALCPIASAREVAQAAPEGKIIEFDTGGHLHLDEDDAKRYIQYVVEAIDAVA